MTLFVAGILVGLILGAAVGRAAQQAGKLFKPQEVKQLTAKTPAQLAGAAFRAGCAAIVLAAAVIFMLWAVLALPGEGIP